MGEQNRTPLRDWLFGERGWVVINDMGDGPQHETVYAIPARRIVEADWVLDGPMRRKAAFAIAREYQSFSRHHHNGGA